MAETAVEWEWNPTPIKGMTDQDRFDIYEMWVNGEPVAFIGPTVKRGFLTVKKVLNDFTSGRCSVPPVKQDPQGRTMVIDYDRIAELKGEAPPPEKFYDRLGRPLPDTTVELTQKELDALLEYSASLPTGTTIGKRWKADRNYGYDKPCWVMGEYYEMGDPKNVGINWYRVVVVNKVEK